MQGRMMPLAAAGLAFAGTLLAVLGASTLPPLGPLGATGGGGIAAIVMLGTVVLVSLVFVAGLRFANGRSHRAKSHRPGEITRPVDKRVSAGGGEQAPGRARYVRLASIKAIAHHLLTKSEPLLGYRTLVTGESPQRSASAEAIALAEALSGAGRQVVLIDWRIMGSRPGDPGPAGGAGINDLLEGRASFETTITRIPGSTVHIIAAGMPARDLAAVLESDRLNLVLDALDEVYQHIVVASGHDDARRLFEATEGRFDAAIAVADGACQEPRLMTGCNRFLGYDVADLEIVRFDRSEEASGTGSGRCIQRMSRPAGITQARPAMT
jgi:hypothetical protein